MSLLTYKSARQVHISTKQSVMHLMMDLSKAIHLLFKTWKSDSHAEHAEDADEEPLPYEHADEDEDTDEDELC